MSAKRRKMQRQKRSPGPGRTNPTSRKSHDEQARFNRQVQDAVGEAREAIDEAEDSPAIIRAKEVLEKGMNGKAKRNRKEIVSFPN